MNRNQAGVTLVEHLISIAIIAMMAVTLVSAYGSLVASKARSRMLQEAVAYGKEYAELVAYISNHPNSQNKIFPHVKNKDDEGCNKIRIFRTDSTEWFHGDEGKSDPHNAELLNGEESNGIFARTLQICPIYRSLIDGSPATGKDLKSNPNYVQDTTIARATIKVRSLRGPLIQPVIFETLLYRGGSF